MLVGILPPGSISAFGARSTRPKFDDQKGLLAMDVYVMTPGQAFKLAHDACKDFSAQIRKLESTPLESNETIDDRMRKIAACALSFANAFEVMDVLVSRFDLNASPAQSSEAPPVHRGVPGEDPTTN